MWKRSKYKRRMSCKLCGSRKNVVERGLYMYCETHARSGDRKIIAHVQKIRDESRPYDWEIDD